MSSDFLYPIISMLTLTFVVWLYMYLTRLQYILAHRINAQDLHRPEELLKVLPEPVNRPANNFKNLCELPIIFYGLMPTAALLNVQSPLFIFFIWGFVVFRVLHSIIHCSYNKVMHRFICYVISSLSLWLAVIIFILGVL